MFTRTQVVSSASGGCCLDTVVGVGCSVGQLVRARVATGVSMGGCKEWAIVISIVATTQSPLIKPAEILSLLNIFLHAFRQLHYTTSWPEQTALVTMCDVLWHKVLIAVGRIEHTEVGTGITCSSIQSGLGLVSTVAGYM